eukprot:TRINITY_DN1063_c0_g1_i1.p1 TRINITY_DN1063_c0_g1~~TRINITY_DN1063_c0_g1_i1.p1  ORF type:complete len:566 (+),score=41.12 TRINITY_DN1063_c0_g1_i1:210-1907(+)
MLPWRRRSCNGLLRRPARRSAPLFLALLVCSITWSAVEMAELELAQDGPQTKSAAGDDPLEGDLDGDGVRDTVDQCPKTPAGKEVDWTGCNYDDHMAIHSSSSSTSGGPPGHLLDGKTDTFWDSHANRGSTAVGSTVTFRGGYGDGVAYQYYCRSDPSRDSRVFCDSAELGEYEQFKIERGPWSDPDRTDNKGWPHVAMKNLGTESYCWGDGGPQNIPGWVCARPLGSHIRSWETWTMHPQADGTTYNIQAGRAPGIDDAVINDQWRGRRGGFAIERGTADSVLCDRTPPLTVPAEKFQVHCLKDCEALPEEEQVDFHGHNISVVFDTGCPFGVEASWYVMRSFAQAGSPKTWRISGGPTPETTAFHYDFNSGIPWKGERLDNFRDLQQARYFRLAITSTHGGTGARLSGFTLPACPKGVCECLWDTDNDGVLDVDDQCPDSTPGQRIYWNGCNETVAVDTTITGLQEGGSWCGGDVPVAMAIRGPKIMTHLSELQCGFDQDVDCNGNDHSEKGGISSKAECCELCMEDPQCAVAVLATDVNVCMLKTGCDNDLSRENRVRIRRG